MKVVIIEDEGIATRRLKKIIHEIDPQINIIAEIDSVEEGLKWFRKYSTTQIDLVFSDIHLSDGLAFEIFEDTHIAIPVIFTTAYDVYALRAFKLNGVDYLLKPIQKADLEKAIAKLQQTKKMYSHQQLSDIQTLISQFSNQASKNQSFISYQKDRIIPLEAGNIAYFFIENLIVYAVTGTQKYVLEENMEDIEKRLSDTMFFRANRQFIIQRKYVVSAELYFNNRLLVHLNVTTPEPVIISREKSAAFKNWLAGF
ncbi:MAG: LytTR family DNA-binding domain-containing protein [Lentimicrobium sp.]|nr:LytTR family DNA-binding domain-containing protein [Lentimicrobium sp.]